MVQVSYYTGTPHPGIEYAYYIYVTDPQLKSKQNPNGKMYKKLPLRAKWVYLFFALDRQRHVNLHCSRWLYRRYRSDGLFTNYSFAISLGNNYPPNNHPPTTSSYPHLSRHCHHRGIITPSAMWRGRGGGGGSPLLIICRLLVPSSTISLFAGHSVLHATVPVEDLGGRQNTRTDDGSGHRSLLAGGEAPKEKTFTRVLVG